MLNLSTCFHQDGTVQQDLDLVSSHILISDLYFRPAVLNSPFLLWEILGINSHSDKTPTERARFIHGFEHCYQSLQT